MMITIASFVPRLRPWAVVALMAAATGCLVTEPRQNGKHDPRRITALMLDSKPQLDPQVGALLAEAGIDVVTRELSAPLTDEMLDRFHVVILPGFRGASAVESFFIVPHTILRSELSLERNLEKLKSYVDRGGALLIMPSMRGSGSGTARRVSDFLEPYGARLHALQIRDPDRETIPHFARTSAIGRHRATDKVKTIFYPHNMLRWDDGYATPVLELNENEWSVLVRGMPGSRAAKGFHYDTWQPTEKAAPPIAAVRKTGGEGRLGLLAVNNIFVFRQPFASPKRGWIGEARVGAVDGIFLKKGDGENPSDGLLLVRNMLRWLSEPALRDPGRGDYDETSFSRLAVPPMPEVPAWLRSWNRESGTLPQHILLGARSRFSDGSGTPAEYARAASEAGLALLVMTETFEHFDPDRWEEFVAACRAAGDENIAVIPGIDIADRYGTRHLLFGGEMEFPKPELLTEDRKRIVKTQYLSLGLGVGVAVAHGIGSQLHHPHPLLKHYFGISVLTYRDGKIVDDAREAYAWQVDAYSNPMPMVTHELFSPADLADAAKTGLQLYVMAPDKAAAEWYLAEMSGHAHFYETPLRLMLSSGATITELRAGNFLKIESDKPIREVRLHDRGRVIRRWKPRGSTFILPEIKLPESNKTWTYLSAVDDEGVALISPGILSGRNSKWGYTWRCGDRQNWLHPFMHLYTGQEIFHFDVQFPGFKETGNLAAVHEFLLSSRETYIADAHLAFRYPESEWNEYARDAKPVPRTAPFEGYRGKIRFHQFYHPQTRGWNRPHTNNLPTLKKIELELLKPMTPPGKIFPQILRPGVRSDYTKEPADLGKDRSFAFVDPASGREMRGELSEGTLDVPPGGRIGGLIVLSGILRVSAEGVVGFPAPDDSDKPLPAGARMEAEFVTVQPEKAEYYRRMMGLSASPPPFAIELFQGERKSFRYIETVSPGDGGIRGTVSRPHHGEYHLPMVVEDMNPNWEAAIWRPGGVFRPIPIFENQAWARLNVAKPVEFYIGHTIMADNPDLCLGILRWDDERVEIEVHNPTDHVIESEIRTARGLGDRREVRTRLRIDSGQSRIVVETSQK